MKAFKKYFLGIVALSLMAVAITACQDDPIVVVSGETDIRSISIINAGITGTDVISGTISGKTITFNIPAESDVENVRFSSIRSLGATIEGGDVHNFLYGHELTEITLTKTIRVVNVHNYSYYEVTLNLEDPTENPIVDRFVVALHGVESVAVIDHFSNTIFLGLPADVDEVDFREVILRPARTEYEFTELNNGRFNRSNPGSIKLDFMGITNEFAIDFGAADFTPGLNFSKAVVHDFSARGTMYPTFTGDMTRSADFDGNYVLIVSRLPPAANYTLAPRVHRVSDLLAGDMNNPIMLDIDPTIVYGGTHRMSAGRLSHGRIFITNLVTDNIAQPLTVYFYETPTSAPQRVLEFVQDPAITTQLRWGDNISVNLNEDGDGYVFFATQMAADVLRFTVTGFTNFSDPFHFQTNPAFTFYAYVNEVEPNRNLITSTERSVIHMIDNNGNFIMELNKRNHENIGVNSQFATDVRIINHNRGRYMLMASARRGVAHPYPALIMYNITDGFDLMTALGNFQNNQPSPAFFYRMDGAPTTTAPGTNTNWATVDGGIIVFASSANAGFVLIEIPNNE